MNDAGIIFFRFLADFRFFYFDFGHFSELCKSVEKILCVYGGRGTPARARIYFDQRCYSTLERGITEVSPIVLNHLTHPLSSKGRPEKKCACLTHNMCLHNNSGWVPVVKNKSYTPPPPNEIIGFMCTTKATSGVLTFSK